MEVLLLLQLHSCRFFEWFQFTSEIIDISSPVCIFCCSCLQGVTVEAICVSIKEMVKHNQARNATIINTKCTIDHQRPEAIQIIMVGL